MHLLLIRYLSCICAVIITAHITPIFAQNQLSIEPTKSLDVMIPEAVRYNNLSAPDFRTQTADIKLKLFFDADEQISFAVFMIPNLPGLIYPIQIKQFESTNDLISFTAELKIANKAPQISENHIHIKAKLRRGAIQWTGSYEISSKTPDDQALLKQWRTAMRTSPMKWETRFQAFSTMSSVRVARDGPYGPMLAKPRITTARVNLTNHLPTLDKIKIKDRELLLKYVQSDGIDRSKVKPVLTLNQLLEEDQGIENAFHTLYQFVELQQEHTNEYVSLKNELIKSPLLHNNAPDIQVSNLPVYDARVGAYGAYRAMLAYFLLKTELSDKEQQRLMMAYISGIKIVNAFMDKAVGDQGGSTSQYGWHVTIRMISLLHQLTETSIKDHEKLLQVPLDQMIKAHASNMNSSVIQDRALVQLLVNNPNATTTHVFINSPIRAPHSNAGETKLYYKDQLLAGSPESSKRWSWPASQRVTQQLVSKAPIKSQPGAYFTGHGTLWRVRSVSERQFSISMKLHGYESEKTKNPIDDTDIDGAHTWRVIAGYHLNQTKVKDVENIWLTLDGAYGFDSRTRKLQIPINIENSEQVKIRGNHISIHYPQIDKTLSLHVLYPDRPLITLESDQDNDAYNLIVQVTPIRQTLDEAYEEGKARAIDIVEGYEALDDLEKELEDDEFEPDKAVRERNKKYAGWILERLYKHTSSAKMGAGDRRPKADSNLMILWTLHAPSHTPTYQVYPANKSMMVKTQGIHAWYEEGLFQFKEVGNE